MLKPVGQANPSAPAALAAAPLPGAEGAFLDQLAQWLGAVLPTAVSAEAAPSLGGDAAADESAEPAPEALLAWLDTVLAQTAPPPSPPTVPALAWQAGSSDAADAAMTDASSAALLHLPPQGATRTLDVRQTSALRPAAGDAAPTVTGSAGGDAPLTLAPLVPAAPTTGSLPAALASNEPQPGAIDMQAALRDVVSVASGADSEGIAPLTAPSDLARPASAERVASPAPSPPPLDPRQPQAPAQLAEIVLRQVDQHAQEVHIRLHPEELGALDVRLKLEGDRLSLRFDLADASVRDVVQTSLPQLSTQLAARGLVLEQAQVFTQQDRGEQPQAQPQAPSQADSGSARETGDESPDAASSSEAPRMHLRRTWRVGAVDDYA